MSGSAIFYSYLAGLLPNPWKDKQVLDKLEKESNSIQSVVQKENEEILRDTEEIKNILVELKSQEAIKHKELLNRYPTGYLLFAADYSGLIIPPNSHALEDYKLDWVGANIEVFKDDTLCIRLPELTYTSKDKSIRNSLKNSFFRFPKGKAGAFYQFQPHFKKIPDNFFIEIISDSSDGIILCLGFRNKTLGSPTNQ